MNNCTLFLSVVYKSGKRITYKCFDYMSFYGNYIHLHYRKNELFGEYHRCLDLSKINFYVLHRSNDYVEK